MELKECRVAERNSYKVEIYCTNCGQGVNDPMGDAQEVRVFKGTLVKDSLISVKCANCGCAGVLERKS